VGIEVGKGFMMLSKNQKKVEFWFVLSGLYFGG
jgi:hypothetical protein